MADLTTTNPAENLGFAGESLETPALTKAQLAELLFEQIGLNKRESKDMIDAFFDLVASSLVEGKDVKISGFGNFQIRTKAPRPTVPSTRPRSRSRPKARVTVVRSMPSWAAMARCGGRRSPGCSSPLRIAASAAQASAR